MGARMTIRGEEGVSRRFRGIADNAEDVSRAWPRVGAYLSREVQRQFQTNGANFGTPWKPLKPEYKLWKLRNGFGNRTLVKSGAMKKTFTGRPMDIEEYGPKSARFGSNDQKAIWQHYGTHRNGKRAIPPRKILVVTRRVRSDVKDIVKDHILGGSR